MADVSKPVDSLIQSQAKPGPSKIKAAISALGRASGSIASSYGKALSGPHGKYVLPATVIPLLAAYPGGKKLYNYIKNRRAAEESGYYAPY